MNLEKFLDKGIETFYIDKLYFIEYNGKILFQKKGVRGHKNKADAINRFFETIFCSYLHKVNYKFIFYKKDLEQLFKDFELDITYIEQLELHNTLRYCDGVSSDIEYYKFKDVSNLLYEKYFKDLINIVKL